MMWYLDELRLIADEVESGFMDPTTVVEHLRNIVSEH